jgi:hypothetical protein
MATKSTAVVEEKAKGSNSHNVSDRPQPRKWVKNLLITIAITYLGLLLVFPVLNVVYAAFADGFGAFWQALSTEEFLSAARLTITHHSNCDSDQYGIWTMRRLGDRSQSISWSHSVTESDRFTLFDLARVGGANAGVALWAAGLA